MIMRIQPVWLIDEKAIILRSWVWLIPPQPPMRVEVRARMNIRWRLRREEI